MQKDEIEIWDIKKIIPYVRNPAKHPDEDVAKMAGLLKEFGCRPPLLIKSDGELVDGHLRYLASLRLGWDKVPTISCDDWTDAKIKAYRITSRTSAKWAEWDDELLKLEVDDLKEMDFDIDNLGFSDEDFANFDLNGFEKTSGGGDDLPEEVDSEPVVKHGDLFQLGRHKVLCGDCTISEDVGVLMGGEKCNISVTSPPYAMQRKDTYGGVETDKYVEWWFNVQDNIKNILADDGSFFVNIKPHCEDGQRVLYVFDMVLSMVRKCGWLLIDELCWMRSGIPGKVVHRFKNGFEPIYHFSKIIDFKFNPEDVRKYFENIPVLAEKGNNVVFSSKQGINEGVFGTDKTENGLAYPSNVLKAYSNNVSLGHSAAFPTQLPEFFIKAYTDENDNIYEPFLGSGTTLIAAEQTNRICFGMEIAPKYIEVIIRRWHQYCVENDISIGFKHLNGDLKLEQIVNKV